MTEYELNAKGERVSTRFAPGYFQMMADFIREGRIGGHYGNAEITRPGRFGRRKTVTNRAEYAQRHVRGSGGNSLRQNSFSVTESCSGTFNKGAAVRPDCSVVVGSFISVDV